MSNVEWQYCYARYAKVGNDYVLTLVQNTYNEKVSAWLTKKYVARAMYCFSVTKEQELLAMTGEAEIASYIAAFENLVKNESHEDIYRAVEREYYAEDILSRYNVPAEKLDEVVDRVKSALECNDSYWESYWLTIEYVCKEMQLPEKEEEN